MTPLLMCRATKLVFTSSFHQLNETKALKNWDMKMKQRKKQQDYLSSEYLLSESLNDSAKQIVTISCFNYYIYNRMSAICRSGRSRDFQMSFVFVFCVLKAKRVNKLQVVPIAISALLKLKENKSLSLFKKNKMNLCPLPCLYALTRQHSMSSRFFQSLYK